MNTCEATGAKVFELDLVSRYLTEAEIAAAVRVQFKLAGSSIRDVTNGIGEPAYAGILEEALSNVDAPPSVVLVPVGAGVLFDECVEVVESRCLPTRVVGVSVTDSASIADKIYGFYSPYFGDLKDLGRAEHPKFPRHYVVSVSDAEVLEALDLATKLACSAEPSAAAALVPLLTAHTLPPGPVLWINSGNGVPYALR